MRILHVVDSTDTRQGGIARFVTDVAVLCAARGHAVAVATPDPGDAAFPRRDNMPDPGHSPALLLVRRQRSLWLNPLNRRSMRTWIAAADVLHLHGMWSPMGAHAASIARDLRVPYVVTPHGMLDEWSLSQKRAKKQLFLTLFGRRMLSDAACVHFTAEAERDQARPWTSARTAVVPCLMDLADFRDLPEPGLAIARLKIPDDEPIVLFISRLHPKKGVETLLGACTLLRARGRRFHCIIAGTGDTGYVESLHRLAAPLGSSVRFVGHVSGPDRISLLRDAAVMALPTHQENFGLALVETLAAGTPIVTSRGVDIWRELEQLGGSHIVERTPEAFADAIDRVLHNPPAARADALRARARVLTEFADSRIAPLYEQMYQACLARTPPAPQDTAVSSPGGRT